MIKLTPEAIAEIQSLIEKESHPEKILGLRVSVTKGGSSGLSYKLNFETQARNKDRTFNKDGITLITDEANLVYVIGLEIHYESEQYGAGFKFNNPNSADYCSCCGDYLKE